MIQIISHNNGVGLTQDINIITGLLTSNSIPVVYSDWLGHGMQAHTNIFIELLNPKFFRRAKKNYFMPNPEWFDMRWIPYLKYIDLILCKTWDTRNIFHSLGCKTAYSGFTSQDRFLDVPKTRSYVHLPGKSLAKGTSAVIEAFSKSGMPDLKIYTQKHVGNVTPNVTVVKAIIKDEEYKEIQNSNLIHLCPSTYEGFGHYINEAKSCASVVLTTDGPPMNELVGSFGFKCRTRERKRYLVTEKIVSAQVIQETVLSIERASTEELISMGILAREDFLKKDLEFKKRFLEIL